MSWFTERPAARATTRRTPARPWLPPSRQAADPGSSRAAASPPLAFTEAELARAAAAAAAQAERRARAACADEADALRARSLERIARALADTARHRHAAENGAVRQIAELADAIGRALAAEPPSAAGRAPDLIAAMLAAAPDPATARLAVDAAAEEALRPALPEITRRAGFAGNLELRAEPSLATGAVRLSWPGGWLERDPDDAARRVEQLLAAYRDTRAQPPPSPELSFDDARPE